MSNKTHHDKEDRNDDDDDDEDVDGGPRDPLWDALVKTLTPLKGRNARIPSHRINPTLLHQAQQSQCPPTLYDEWLLIPKIAKNTKSYASSLKPPIIMDPNNFKRVSFDATIDLHDMSSLEARNYLHKKLSFFQQNAMINILIITGKGHILKTSLPCWLSQTPEVVHGFCLAKQRHGGDGAFYVRLRRLQFPSFF
jgi:DNA-nicking Smr family endonuclease